MVLFLVKIRPTNFVYVYAASKFLYCYGGSVWTENLSAEIFKRSLNHNNPSI